jgi:dTDP-4-amino-4,6-dideoxygalactose transaminase
MAKSAPIPVQDLKRQYQPLAAPLKAAAARVLDSGWYVLGQEVKAFESEFAQAVGVRECVSVANGTEALELALRVLGVGPCDDVCTVANAGMYSTTAILNVGAKPVYVDVRADTLTMDARDLAARITSRTKAIIVTHLYGCLAHMDELLAAARARGMRVIEDCAQAHGAKRNGRIAGAWADAACFSFYPTKNLGALGDGGAVVTNDPAHAEKLRHLRQYGWTSRYHSSVPGGRNSRLDELQAAFLRVKLPLLENWNQRRREIAARYNAAFARTGLILPRLDHESHAMHLYVVRHPKRDLLREALTQAGVGSDIHYPVADYDQVSVREQLEAHEPLVETKKACGEILTLPCFPELTDDEVAQVIDTVVSAVKHF